MRSPSLLLQSGHVIVPQIISMARLFVAAAATWNAHEHLPFAVHTRCWVRLERTSPQHLAGAPFPGPRTRCPHMSPQSPKANRQSLTSRTEFLTGKTSLKISSRQVSCKKTPTQTIAFVLVTHVACVALDLLGRITEPAPFRSFPTLLDKIFCL